MSNLCARLSETAPTWGKLIAPWAEYVARTLWATTSPSKSERRLSTPLTQQHRRGAKGRPSFSEVKAPKPERLCRGCGKAVQGRSINCAECDADIATKRLVEVAKAGRVAGHTPEAIAKEAATHRKHAQAKAAWNPETQPAWLTNQVFTERIQPALAQASATAIAKRIGVSRWYAGRICGTIFKVSPNADGSWSESIMYNFTGAADGYDPVALAIDAQGNLYGAALFGGSQRCSGGCGTLFKLDDGIGECIRELRAIDNRGEVRRS